MTGAKKYFFSLMLPALLSVFVLHGQTKVDVAEGTVKIAIMSDEFLYFGFAQGDKMIFSFEETNGRELKELEIAELYAASKYLESKTKKIDNKIILIPKTGIYKFRFTNTAVLPRVCKYKIQRIPATAATQNFNTTVYTDPVSDTTYVTEMEDYLEKMDTVFINLQDRISRVNPSSNAGGNKATFSFLLPENIIGWSYYISTGKEAMQAYSDANRTLLSASGQVVSRFPNYNILAAATLRRPAEIPKLTNGAAINYWIIDADNISLFSSGSQFKSIKNGKAVNDYSRMEPHKGNLNFGFLNDHPTDAVNVTVKITSVQVNEVWGKKEIQKMKITQKSRMHLKN